MGVVRINCREWVESMGVASGWNLWVLLVSVARGKYIHNNYYFSLLHFY